jgi:hypothetical protein
VTTDLTISVRGASKLSSTLRKAGVGLVEMKDANERVGSIVASQAKSLAPKRTGALAGGIRPARQARKVVVRANTRGRYPWVQEYGSAKRHIRARNYMSGALAAKREESIAAYLNEMESLIGKVQGDS